MLFLLTALCSASAARADNTRFVTLDVPGSTATVARGLNLNGQVVGDFVYGGVTLGFLYSDGAFSPLHVPHATSTHPRAIDSSGRIAGFYQANGRAHGFLYEQGTYSTVDVPGAIATRALGINDVGQIVGSFTDARGEHGFLRAAGAFTTLDVPGAISTSATGVNSAGEVVGVYTGADSQVHGFLSAGGVFLKLDAPGVAAPRALAINDASQIAGFPGLLYDHGEFTTLDTVLAPQGADRYGIDRQGDIAGSYLDAAGREHGFSTALSGAVTAQVSSGSNLCDINSSGAVNVSDVQIEINEALGLASAANDLNADGVVNVADVQLVINAALGLGCAATAGSQGTASVAHLSVQSGNGQVACICISATLQAFQPISVKATDIHGNPVSGATVAWAVTSGQMMLAGSSSVTNSSGIATQGMSLLILNNFSSPLVPYLVSTIQAASNNVSVIFNETQSLITSQGSSVILANPPQYNGNSLGDITLSGSVGSTSSIPIQTNIGGTGLASNGVPNVSVRIVNQQAAPAVTCVTGPNGADPGSVLSDVHGNTACYPMFSGSGVGSFYVIVGGLPASNLSSALDLEAIGAYNFASNPGPPAAFQLVSGNNQVVPIGQALSPLVARLVDAQGNLVPGQTVSWSVVPAGAAALSNSSLVTDANGEVTIIGSLGLLASAGASIVVSLNSNPTISGTFQETIPGALTAMTKISGDSQTAARGTNFALPLVVKVVNASGPVANFPVRYTFTGPVNLSTVAGTDVNGLAMIAVMAGSSSGSATVTATAGALTQTFTLTVQ